MLEVLVAGIVQDLVPQDQPDMVSRQFQDQRINVDVVFAFCGIVSPACDYGFVTDLDELRYLEQIQTQSPACLNQFFLDLHGHLLSG
jgi:hypothetical protein